MEDFEAHAQHSDEYLLELVGADYASLNVVTVPVGMSGYLDKCDALHLQFERAVKGTDDYGRPFVAFYLELLEDGVVTDRGIFTVFKRYAAQDSMYVVCRSHTLLQNNSIESVIGNVRIGVAESLRLKTLFRSGEYSDETCTLRLTTPPLHTVIGACLQRTCPGFLRLAKYLRRGLNSFWSVVPRFISGSVVDTDAHEHVE